MLAKIQAAKRKRAEADMDMDVDMNDDEEDAEGDESDQMEVDGEAPPSRKRAKGNFGTVIAKNARAARTDRQLAGLRDDQVNNSCLVYLCICLTRYFKSASIQSPQAPQSGSARA